MTTPFRRPYFWLVSVARQSFTGRPLLGQARLIGAAFLLAFLIGCATFQDTGGKVLTSIALTVDSGMRGWSAWMKVHGATPQQEAVVRAAYEKYQLAEAWAEKSYVTAVKSGNKAGWTQAVEVLQASSDSLIALIQSFSAPNPVKTP